MGRGGDPWKCPRPSIPSEIVGKPPANPSAQTGRQMRALKKQTPPINELGRRWRTTIRAIPCASTECETRRRGHRALRGPSPMATCRSVRGLYAASRRRSVLGNWVLSRRAAGRVMRWMPRLPLTRSGSELPWAGGLEVAQVSSRQGSAGTSCHTSGAPTPPNKASCRSRRLAAAAALRDTRPPGGRRQPQRVSRKRTNGGGSARRARTCDKLAWGTQVIRRRNAVASEKTWQVSQGRAFPRRRSVWKG